MLNSRKAILISIACAVIALGSFDISKANATEITMSAVGPPTLTNGFTCTSGQVYNSSNPVLNMWNAALVLGGAYSLGETYDLPAKMTVFGDSSTKFYRGTNNRMYATTNVCVVYAEIGGSTSQWQQGANTPWWWTSTGESAENLQIAIETSWHNRPIYTDSDVDTILYDIEIGNDVYFKAPTNGNTSHDFKTWWVCANIPVTADTSGYSIEVLYGESEAGFSESDSTKDDIGLIPIYDEDSINECPLLSKSAALTTGNYHAQINLLDQDDELLATSEEITFHITSGDQVDFANDGQITRDRSAECDIKWSNFFTREACKLGVFLLAPDTDQLQAQLDDLKDRLANNVPFSYFYQQKETIEGIAVSTDNEQLFDVDLPIETGTISTTLAFGGFDTGDTRIQNVLSPFRSWINIFLYITLGGYFIFRALRFFRPL